MLKVKYDYDKSLAYTLPKIRKFRKSALFLRRIVKVSTIFKVYLGQNPADRSQK